jgi:hypothetical protein
MVNTVVKTASRVSSRWVFISQTCIAFVVSLLICVYLYIPGPLIFIAPLLLNPSNLKRQFSHYFRASPKFVLENCIKGMSFKDSS